MPSLPPLPCARSLLLCAFLAASSWSGPARAEEATDTAALARELFDQGRLLVEARDYEKACPKFAESYRLNPGGGTLLNLAVCHELQGKTATAWAEFQDALRIARRDDRADRQALAEEHLAVLGPKLSRLRVVVPEAARAKGLTIHRNGVLLGEAAWGVAVPVDPGEQSIEITAPHKRSSRQSVVVTESGETREISIAPLADAPVSKAPPPERPPPPRSDEQSDGTSQRLWGGVLAGAGVVGFGVGTYLSIRAVGLKGDANDACPDPQRCAPSAVADSRSAVQLADVSTGVFVTSAVLAGVGAYLFFTAPSARTPRPAVGVLPGGADFRVTGAF